MLARIIRRQLSLTVKTLGPIEDSIRTKLVENFNPSVLEIINESGGHRLG